MLNLTILAKSIDVINCAELVRFSNRLFKKKLFENQFASTGGSRGQIDSLPAYPLREITPSHLFYSFFKLSTGLAIAALMDW